MYKDNEPCITYLQVGQATTQNPKLQGEPFYVKDKGVLRCLDPYLSTTNQDHRAFKPAELKRYPKKDVATYWDCEEYPKAWGHGLKHKYVNPAHFCDLHTFQHY